MKNSTQRFGSRSDAYARYRPHYPDELLPFLKETVGMTPSMSVADIGSGTGISAELFLKNGNTVYCVEPNDAMRAKAEEQFSGLRGFVSVNGRSDRTGIPDSSIDIIIAAQAFHWFDRVTTRREFLRIGRPDAWTIILWNDRRLETPFERAYEHFLNDVGTDYKSINHKNISDSDLSRWYGPKGCGKRIFHTAQVLDIEAIKGRLLSVSYVPGPGEPGFDEMMGKFHRLFEAHQQNGSVGLGYDTRVYFGRLH